MMIWRPNVTVAAIIERDRHFLFVEERVDGHLVLNQPAGHLEEGESLVDAVARETLEETAFHFTPDAVIGVYRWRNPRNGTTYLRFAFTGPLMAHESGRALDHGIERTVWLTADELAICPERHRSPQVARCVADYLGGTRYPLSLLHDVL